MVMQEFELFDRPAFLDYLRGGWGFTLTGAIDYTSSNGNPQGKNSLHYLGPENQYMQTINEIGGIIASYDHDKQFSFYGFGGIPKGKDAVEHSFPINNQQNACINGSIQDVINTYKKSVEEVNLAGPT